MPLRQKSLAFVCQAFFIAVVGFVCVVEPNSAFAENPVRIVKKTELDTPLQAIDIYISPGQVSTIEGIRSGWSFLIDNNTNTTHISASTFDPRYYVTVKQLRDLTFMIFAAPDETYAFECSGYLTPAPPSAVNQPRTLIKLSTSDCEQTFSPYSGLGRGK